MLNFSAGGFKDFTRIAASHPVMWRDIILMNKDNMLPLIDHFKKVLEEFKAYIVKEDAEGLASQLDKSRTVRKMIE